MSQPELDVRNTQTKTKHLILEKYAGVWGGIILNGLQNTARQQAPGYVHLVYVDGFAAQGRYLRDSDAEPGHVQDTVFGSPIIGIRSLDKMKQYAEEKFGLKISVTAILCEENPSRFKTLRESLAMAALGERVKVMERFDCLQDGDIAVVNADFRQISDRVGHYTRSPKFSLVLLDPYGPAGIPYSLVKTFVAGERCSRDVIINFPYQDLHKKTGFVGRSDSTAQSVLRNYTSVFGDDAQWMEEYVSSADNAAEVEKALVEHYHGRLESMDSSVTIKRVPLLFPNKNRTMFYLFLTTHDPNGALTMNEILWNAKLEEGVLRQKHSFVTAQSDKGPSMFAFEELEPDAGTRQPPEVDVDALATSIAAEFAGRSVPYRDILRSQADTLHWAKHVRAALAKLRKSGVAHYDALKSGDLVDFAASRNVSA